MAYTLENFTQWATTNGLEVPKDAAQTLRQADLLVREFLTRCPPAATEAQVAAVEEATYAQAAYWHANGITPMAEDVQTKGKVVASASLIGASMTYADTGIERVQSRERAARSLCLEARLILAFEGIEPAQPSVVG